MISVIVPVYGVEEFIEDCILSIIEQTYQDIELILIDDGSLDNSGNICKLYSKIDNRIVYIRRENGGLSAARNSGIYVSRGDYLFFVDGDDFIPQDILENMINAAQKFNADIVAVDYVRCEEEVKRNDFVIPHKEIKLKEYTDSSEKMKVFLEGKKIGTSTWAKLYKADLFEDIRFPEGKIHEDVYTTYKLVHKSKKIVELSCIGYIYRKNKTSITSKQFSNKNLDIIYGKLEQAKFILNYYPELVDLAYTGIIYGCNVCLSKMVDSSCNKKDLVMLQQLYRKYGCFYLKSNVALYKKIIVFLCSININISNVILTCFKKYFVCKRK